MDEERLVIWHGIPNDSTLRIQVTTEMATVEGTGFIKSSAGVKVPLVLRERELVERPLTVRIRSGERFFLLIELTYLSPHESTASVEASITDDNGDPVINADGQRVEPFHCEYTGSLGGANATDEVEFNVRGVA
jgi:hypothetical protein